MSSKDKDIKVILKVVEEALELLSQDYELACSGVNIVPAIIEDPLSCGPRLVLTFDPRPKRKDGDV